MKFTNKFIAITSTVVLTCIVLLIAGGMVSLRSLSFKYHHQRIDGVIQVIEKQLDKKTERVEFEHWLPDVLDASGIVRFKVLRDNTVIYKNYLETRNYYPSTDLLHYTYHLERYPNITLDLQTRQPFSDLQFTFWPLVGVGSAIFLCLSLLLFSLRWIKKSFIGAELLERRSRYILQNNPTARFAQSGEWPKTASKALDVLSERLEKSRKERSVFDIHIRGQAFLDEDTGLGNYLAFENRLDAVAMDESYSSNTLMLISLTELSTLKDNYDVKEENKVIHQVVGLLNNFCRRYSDSFYARADKEEFVVILPQTSYEETEVAAKQLTKLLFQLQLPEKDLIERFFYVGVANFPFGCKVKDILEEVNRSLLIAEQQTLSGWHLSEDDFTNKVIIKGTVRWRSLLNDVLAKNALLLYQQDVVKRDAKSTLYSELWPRIRDENNDIITAGTFMPMAEKCGLCNQLDKQMLEKVLSILLRKGSSGDPIAVNLGATLLLNKSIHKWFMFELLQQPRAIRHNLVIEVSEHLIEKNYSALRVPLVALQKVGCKIAVDNVGKSVINTEYILDFNIDYLKLHTSLVKDIHLRKTNQVAIQSLMASCLNSGVRVIAVGVETESEWSSLLKLGVFGGQGALFSTAEQTHL